MTVHRQLKLENQWFTNSVSLPLRWSDAIVCSELVEGMNLSCANVRYLFPPVIGMTNRELLIMEH
jgi:hypothetical protein